MTEREVLPFSGDELPCPMCGNVRVSMEYREYSICIHPGDDVIHAPAAKNSRIHRRCVRCGYSWDEQTLQDHIKETKKAANK